MRDNKYSKPKLIFGRHPVIDSICTGTSIDKVLLQKGIQPEVAADIKKLAHQFNVPLQEVPKEKLNRVAKGKNHQGVAAFLSLITYHKIEDILPHLFEQSKTPLFLILDGITDVRNFGAIARSAECLGVHAIIIPEKGAAQINGEALKTSAGALNKIPVCRVKSLRNTVQYLKMSGLQIVASSLEGDKELADIDWGGPTGIVVGAEGDGVSNEILKIVNDTFIIPQIGETDSLNVSVATGITLYEVLGQRQKK